MIIIMIIKKKKKKTPKPKVSEVFFFLQMIFPVMKRFSAL